MTEGDNTTAETADDDLDARAVLHALGPIAVLGGSVVLVKLLLALLVRALRAAANMPQQDTPVFDEDGDEEKPKAKAPAKGKAKGKTKPGKGFGDALEGAGIAVLCVAAAVGTAGTLGALLWALLTPWHSYIIGVLIVAWYLTAAGVALLRSQEEEDEEEAEDGEDTADEHEDDEDDTENDHEVVGEQPSPSPTISFPQAEEALIRHVLTEVLGAVKAGRKGVHLSTLVAAMPPGWDVSLLRLVLANYRIPVQKMQIRGFGNTWGIHIDALRGALTGPLEQHLITLARAPEPHLIQASLWPEQMAARAAVPAAPAAPAQTPVPAVPPAPVAPPPAPSVPAPVAPAVEAPAVASQKPAMARILGLVKGSSPDRVA